MTGVKPSGQTGGGGGRRDQCVNTYIFLNELTGVVITVVIRMGWDEKGPCGGGVHLCLRVRVDIQNREI